MPDGLCLRQVEQYEERIELNGTVYLYNKQADTHAEVFPTRFLETEYKVITHVTDRGPTVACPLWFLVQGGYLTWPWFGFFHGQRNALKEASRRTKHGVVWNAILLMTNVYNLNCGPFRSKAWYRMKQDVLTNWLATHTHESVEFQGIVEWWGDILGLADVSSESAQRALFQRMGHMRSFEEVGPVFKLMRWCSLKQVHDFYRPELPGLKIILGEMSRHTDAEQMERVLATTASSEVELDAEVARLRESLQKKGKVHVAFRAIREKVIDSIDAFIAATTTDQQLYSQVATHEKDPGSGLERRFKKVQGAWREYFYNVAKGCIFDVDQIRYAHAHLDNERGRTQADLLAELLLQIMRCRGSWIQVRNLAYPGCSAAMLASDPDARLQAKRSMLRDFKALLCAERLRYRHEIMNELVDAIYWAPTSIVRLVFHLNEAELRLPEAQRPVPSPTEALLRKLHCGWSDEKGAEDTHQHIRDEQRTKRNPHIAGERVFGAAIDANIPGARGVAHLTVGQEVLEDCRRREMQGFNLKTILQGPPVAWDARLDKILHPTHVYKSPTLLGEVNSTSAWLWLQRYVQNIFPTRSRPARSGMLSRLCCERHLLANLVTGETQIIVSRHPWHYLGWNVRRVADSDEQEQYMFRLGDKNLDTRFLTTFGRYRLAPCTGVYNRKVSAVVFQRSGPWGGLLPAALLQAVSLSMPLQELIRADLGFKLPDAVLSQKVP